MAEDMRLQNRLRCIYFSLPFDKKGSEKLWLKNTISGPIKNAVIKVPIPGISPDSVPMMTHNRSQPILTNLNGSFLFSAITIGIASYTETPRLEVI